MWAIRHKLTNRYLPMVFGKGRLRKGGTCTTLNDRGVPRLFLRIGDAKQCLQWWLEGPKRMTYDGDLVNLRRCEVTNPEEMEIVEVCLVVKGETKDND